MELVTLAKEVFQNVAERAASYRIGQSILKYLDRTLWVVEKCAKWAVPPPLDQDERPQPELVRPLPWVFFLAMLIALRIARESISLVNLVRGKPPLRSADVVMYIQSKRRYLRTLKYQGNRMMRARTSIVQPRESWTNSIHSLFEFTMCFRRQSSQYGNNNTTRISNNDEVLVMKRNKRGREQASPGTSTSETTMERLIEKMMVDLDADSDEDSSFTLTAVSPKSDQSDFTIDSDQEAFQNNVSSNQEYNSSTEPLSSSNSTLEGKADISAAASSTPEKSSQEGTNDIYPTTPKEAAKEEESRRLHDTTKIPRTPNNEQKIANGRPSKGASHKKRGSAVMEKDSRGADKHSAKTASGKNTM